MNEYYLFTDEKKFRRKCSWLLFRKRIYLLKILKNVIGCLKYQSTRGYAIRAVKDILLSGIGRNWLGFYYNFDNDILINLTLLRKGNDDKSIGELSKVLGHEDLHKAFKTFNLSVEKQEYIINKLRY